MRDESTEWYIDTIGLGVAQPPAPQRPDWAHQLAGVIGQGWPLSLLALVMSVLGATWLTMAVGVMVGNFVFSLVRKVRAPQ